MKTHRCNIEELQGLDAAGVSITYNTDGADSAVLTLKPTDYARLGWAAGERVELGHAGRKVFAGVLPTDAQYAVSGGQAESVSVTLMSDFYVLDSTVYARQNGRGEVIFPGVLADFTELRTLAHNVYNWASGWSGSKLNSAFECELSGRIPTPQSNGTTSCAGLIQQALQWTPDAVVVQRYAEEGDTLLLTTPEAFEPLSLGSDDLVAAVSLQRRLDLSPHVCALVGGAHLVLPEGGDVREPGAFVHAVPLRKRDGGGGAAGGSLASSKMIVRGVPIPDRYQFERGVEEFRQRPVEADSDTAKFLGKFFPQYARWKNELSAGACVVSVVSEEALAAGAEQSEDEDAQPVPANYSAEPKGWGGTGSTGGIYVLTEGSFNASSNGRKNVKGLKWCKASLAMSVTLKKSEVKEAELPTVLELFPGRSVNNEGEVIFFANLTLDAVLINKRRKVYDPATNKLCAADDDYSEEEDEEATRSDYVSAMTAYYNATREVFTEGSITLLEVGAHAPETLTGRLVTLSGFREEWGGMHAVVRSVAWDPMRLKLELQVGPRAVLGFGEYLERKLMAKRTGENEAKRQAVAYDPRDEQAEAAAEAEMSVSPSVSAGLGSHTTGKWRKPWTLYPVVTGTNADGQVEFEWWLQGGTLTRGKKSFNVPNTNRQIVAGEETDKPWVAGMGKVRCKFYRQGGVLTYDIYQK